MSLQRQNFLLSYLKTLSIGPVMFMYKFTYFHVLLREGACRLLFEIIISASSGIFKSVLKYTYIYNTFFYFVLFRIIHQAKVQFTSCTGFALAKGRRSKRQLRQYFCTVVISPLPKCLISNFRGTLSAGANHSKKTQLIPCFAQKCIVNVLKTQYNYSELVSSAMHL